MICNSFMINLLQKKYWATIALCLIVLLATILRLWQLGLVPPSPDWDEVSLGYNAYSVLHTGKDEYGRFLPVIMESTGDFKPALYAYLAIPSIALFGLNVFATRLPSAIVGIFAVLACYFIVIELFSGKRVNPKIEGYIHAAGMVLLLALIILVTIHDVLSFF